RSEGGVAKLIRLGCGRAVGDGAKAAIVEASGVVAGLGGVTEPIVLKALAQDAARERDVGTGRGATRVLLIGVARDLRRVGTLPIVVATRILVPDVDRTVQIVVLDLLG